MTASALSAAASREPRIAEWNSSNPETPTTGRLTFFLGSLNNSGNTACHHTVVWAFNHMLCIYCMPVKNIRYARRYCSSTITASKNDTLTCKRTLQGGQFLEEKRFWSPLWISANYTLQSLKDPKILKQFSDGLVWYHMPPHTHTHTQRAMCLLVNLHLFATEQCLNSLFTQSP